MHSFTDSIMFLAGDPSGDKHASPILRQLKRLLPDFKCFGIGGSEMESNGFVALLPFEEFNRMGIIEVLAHLPFFLKAKRQMIAAMKSYKPKVLVCVDFPGFNIALLKAARKLNIPVVWYIAPQVWAWKKKRAAVLGNLASYIGVVFPFETDFFKPYCAPVFFVGHPLVEAMENRKGSAPARLPLASPQAPFNLSLIPGSRYQEVKAILPTLVEAALILKGRYPNLRITVSEVKSLPMELFKTLLGDSGIELYEGALIDLLNRTDAAFVTSGTATLETALAGAPMVIVYKTSPINYALMKRMIKIPFIGLPNIVAGEKIVPECIQSQACGVKLAAQMSDLISSKARYLDTVEKLSRLKDKLGGKNPSREIAQAISALVTKRSCKN
jgi:lipid-A-disaccharide synthase